MKDDLLECLDKVGMAIVDKDNAIVNLRETLREVKRERDYYVESRRDDSKVIETSTVSMIISWILLVAIYVRYELF